MTGFLRALGCDPATSITMMDDMFGVSNAYCGGAVLANRAVGSSFSIVLP